MFLLRRPYVFYVIGAAILLGGVGFYFFRSSGQDEFESVVAKRREITQEVSVTGKVKPSESVDLGFDKSGRITKISAKVGARVSPGQVLAQIYNADLFSELAQTQAVLKSEQAKLDKLKRGSRPEDIEISRAKVAEAKQNLVDKMEDAYTKADDAIHIKIDQFFSNPRTNPQLTFATESQLEADLESSRLLLEARFKAWNSSREGINVNANLYSFAGEISEHLGNIKSFLDVMAIAVNGTAVEAYKTDVSAARASVNTAINNVSSAVTNLRVAESELALEEAGSTPEDILVQEAAVEKAEASVNNIKAQISKTMLVSPIRGVITRQDAKVGEIISASAALVSVISDAKFQIEANLPEADVAKVKVGDSARLTLDAFSSDVVFDAVVVALDPAETVIEGVSTYKVTLEFVREDEQIRSGLTANIDILTARKENALAIPQRAVINRDGEKFVRVQNPDGRVDELKIELGLIGSDGEVEVLSGIEEGMNIIISRESD